MNRLSIVFLTLFLQHSIVQSQEAAHRMIKERMASKNIPGIAFIIAKDGKVIEEGYYGKANLEVDADITSKSVFAIASMSKTYTAAAILIMAEQGLLHLDDKVNKYIPEVPISWNLITIKHLLTHSSGLVDDWALYDWDTSNQLFLETHNDSLFLEHLFTQKLLFKPGSSHSYSCGPFVLGVIIEKITGQPYGQFLETNVFKPLNLTETYVDNPYKIIPNRVSGYFKHDLNRMDSRISGLGNGILVAPAAYGRADVGIRTTTHDLLKFYDALLSTTLLNERSRKTMFGPSSLDNGNFISTGAGWMNWPLGGLWISEHSGAFRTGYSSQALVIPKDRFMVIILSNMHGGVSFSMAQEVASIYYPELEQLSKKPPAIDNKTDLTNTHLGFFQKISSNDQSASVNKAFPFSYYSKKLKESISKAESVEYLGERNIQKKDINLFGVKIYTLRYYRLSGKMTYYTTVYLDKDNKVVFMDYPETE